MKENGIKLQEELINQPSNSELGLNKLNSMNVDYKIEDLINNYEIKYGKVELEKCDFKTKFYEKSICENKVDKKKYNDFVLIQRNLKILNKIENDKKNKIALIYGKEHFVMIKDSIIKLGFIKTY